MPEANLEVKRKQALSVQEIEEDLFVPQVTYHLSDSTHYVFEHEVDENTHVRMDESNQEANYSKFADAEFDEQISDSDKIYYVIAAASGLLTGSLSLFHLKTESLENISEWSDKAWKDFIILAAKVAGYKKGDYKGAAHHLQKKVVQLTVDHLEPEFREALLNNL